MRVKLDLGEQTAGFSDGLLLVLLDGLRQLRDGELLAFSTRDDGLHAPLEQWAALSGCAIVEHSRVDGRWRYVIRNGEVTPEDQPVPLAQRLWLYTNFDCNLRCDYCCVRSSPQAARRALPLPTIQALLRQAEHLGTREIFLTGGEPFLLPDIDQILQACVSAFKTTVLTNATLLKGARLDGVLQLPRDRVAFQISLDSPEPELHDLHRGAGTWQRALDGIERLRGHGFRVRFAATVSSEQQATAFSRFLDRHGIALEDRVIRRMALRGLAADGVALSKADLHPEVTVTGQGVYWHPVGADDPDFFVCADPLPLARAVELVRAQAAAVRSTADGLASVFRCA